jgi:hypothetical protein
MSIDTPTALGAYTVMGLALILGGWCRFQINGRRFRRRTIGGGERFPTYAASVLTRLWEGLGMSVATLVMAFALFAGAVLTVVLLKGH